MPAHTRVNIGGDGFWKLEVIPFFFPLVPLVPLISAVTVIVVAVWVAWPDTLPQIALPVPSGTYGRLPRHKTHSASGKGAAAWRRRWTVVATWEFS